MHVPIVIHQERLELSEYHTKKLRELVAKNGSPIRGYIETSLPESRQQRKYLHGGLIPLWIALDNNDYKDSDVNDFYFEQAKMEFSPEAIKVKGKVLLRGKSSRGSKALNTLTEKLLDMLVEHYGLSYNSPVLNPESFEKFRDEIYGSSTYEDYIEYARALKWIP